MPVKEFAFLAVTTFAVTPPLPGPVPMLPSFVLGSWKPIGHVTSMVGPLPLNALNFTAANDEENGEYWMSLLEGQLFRGNSHQMQYCFVYQGNKGDPLHSEQSPFEVSEMTERMVQFCWRAGVPRMPTHKTACMGCDCAKITLFPEGVAYLRFTFEMSPPSHHLDVLLERASEAPGLQHYRQRLWPYVCEYNNHSGQLDLDPASGMQRRMQSETSSVQRSGGCAMGVHSARRLPAENASLEKTPMPLVTYEAGKTVCRQINSMSFQEDESLPDVRFQMVLPSLPCFPCVVKYSLSAAVKEFEYIGLGFKGWAWNRLQTPLRPNYFGMTTEWHVGLPSGDVSTSEGPMLIAYSSSAGACLREMKVEGYVSHPVDIEAKPSFVDWQVERANGRVQVHFGKQEWWGFTAEDISRSASFLRMQWAIGSVLGHPDGSCQEAFGYHSEKRGMSPLNWFDAHGFCAETEEIPNQIVTEEEASAEDVATGGTHSLMLRASSLSALMLWVLY